MQRPLVTYPNPILRKVAKPVDVVDDKIRDILNDMAQTMYAEEGVGLAAPQIGISLRLAVIDITGCKGDAGLGLMKMVNPEIISRDGEIEWDEGCLSVPDFRMLMKRSKQLKLRYLDQDGNKKELDAEDLLAVAVQQEIDHLNGKLIIDSASHLKQDLYTKKIKKLGKE